MPATLPVRTSRSGRGPPAGEPLNGPTGGPMCPDCGQSPVSAGRPRSRMRGQRDAASPRQCMSCPRTVRTPVHGRLPPHSCLRKGSSSAVAVEFHATGDARDVAVALLLSPACKRPASRLSDARSGRAPTARPDRGLSSALPWLSERLERQRLDACWSSQASVSGSTNETPARRGEAAAKIQALIPLLRP